MIPLQEFKDVLGDKVKELTEEEILKLREHQDKETELFLICGWKKKNKNYHIVLVPLFWYIKDISKYA